MQERHAVLWLLGLAVAGHGARLLLQDAGSPPGQVLAPEPGNDDPAAHRARALQVGRPLAAGETIDLNTGSAEQIARLPRVGMSLAKRIVAHRSAYGPFGSLAELDAVPGIGPALLSQLAGKVRLGRAGGALPPPRSELLTQRPASGYGPGRRTINLNSAALADLLELPGIGPVRARAILAYRRERGPFAGVSDLQAVPGFSQSLIRRITPLVTTR